MAVAIQRDETNDVVLVTFDVETAAGDIMHVDSAPKNPGHTLPPTTADVVAGTATTVLATTTTAPSGTTTTVAGSTTTRQQHHDHDTSAVRRDRRDAESFLRRRTPTRTATARRPSAWGCSPRN